MRCVEPKVRCSAHRIRTGTLVAYVDRGAIEITLSAGDPYSIPIEALCVLQATKRTFISRCYDDCVANVRWRPDAPW